MIFNILASILRVVFFAGLTIALLGVKKTRFRHVSSRRTRIPRHHGETTLWVERLLNAILEMLYCSAPLTVGTHSTKNHPNSVSSKYSDTKVEHIEKGNRDNRRLENVFSFLDTLLSSSEGEGNERGGSQVPYTQALSNVLLPHFPSEFERRALRAPAVDSSANLHTLKYVGECSKTQSVISPNFDFSRSNLSFSSPERCDPAEESVGVRPELIRQLEERVAAALEDRGIAAWAEFRINALGDKLPRIKAIHVLHTNEPHDSSNLRNVMLEKLNASTQPIVTSAAPSTMAAEMSVMPNLFQTQLPSLQQNVFRGHRPRPSTEHVNTWGAFNDTADRHLGVATETVTATSAHDSTMKLEINSKISAAGHNIGDSGVQGETQAGVARTGAHSSNRSPRVLPLSPNIAGPSKGSAGGTIPDPISIEVELEVEYSGGLEVSLQADLSFMRGRHLPVYVRVGNVRNFRAHMRALLTLQFDSSGMEFPGKPFLELTFWLESDPSFDMTMHSTLTPLRIKDFFLFPVLIKFFLLRFLRSKMRHSRGPGVTIKVPLPGSVVDNGVERWCNGSSIREGHTTENKGHNTTNEADSNILRKGINNTINFYRSSRYGSSSPTPVQPLGRY